MNPHSAAEREQRWTWVWDEGGQRAVPWERADVWMTQNIQNQSDQNQTRIRRIMSNRTLYDQSTLYIGHNYIGAM